LLLSAGCLTVPALTPAVVADLNTMRSALSLFVLAIPVAGACSFSSGTLPSDDDAAPDAGGIDGATGCAEGHAGAACVIARYEQAAGTCDAAELAAVASELDVRAGEGPLWSGGRALFWTQAPVHVAGTFNSWSPSALRTEALCETSIVAALGVVPSGFHSYKLVSGQTWSLDPNNPAFAHDDFVGNTDGKNSVLNTHDSGRGHLVWLDRACSTALGNCRDVTAYLPPGYHAPGAATVTYPVLFMHDGKNVWDDKDCCFGHTGWELNVALDNELAAGRIAPPIVIAADQTAARNDEYGLSAAKMSAFMQFQVGELQPRALAKVRGNGTVLVGGSSLGGLVSMHLALRYPQTYAGAVSLSGAFWPGKTTQSALRDQLPAMGKQALAIYLDHGGYVAGNSDGAADSVEIRDLLVNLGWQRNDSPTCSPGPNGLCYFHEPGAAHDELAWRARSWRFLRFLFAKS
jgi:predicted alpha/beta superfamily hydrolase